MTTTPTGRNGTREQRRVDGPTFRVGLVLTFVAAIAIAFVVTGIVAAPSRRSDLWFELAGAGIQLFVVAIVGTAVTFALRDREVKRDERRRLDEYRLSLRHELLDAYHRIKAVRRTLRGLGFDAPEPDGTLGADQCEEFLKEMRALVNAQLSLEMIEREIPAQEPIFRPDAERIEELVKGAEEYVNEVIKDWERYGTEIVAGSKTGQATMRLQNLRDFLASAKDGEFKDRVSEPLEKVEELILNGLLNPPPRHATRSSGASPTAHA